METKDPKDAPNTSDVEKVKRSACPASLQGYELVDWTESRSPPSHESYKWHEARIHQEMLRCSTLTSTPGIVCLVRGVLQVINWYTELTTPMPGQ